MFQQWDYGVKLTKEQEIRDRIRRAQVERLVQSVQPRREMFLSRFLRHLGDIVKGILLKVAVREALKAKNIASQTPGARRVWTMHLRGG